MDEDMSENLFPPMNQNSNDLETADINTTSSSIFKNQNTTINNPEEESVENYEMELNREAPGLFPPLKSINRYESSDDMFQNEDVLTDLDKDITTETESQETFNKYKHKNIDFKTFQKRILEKLPVDYENQLINDKFFLTKMYTLNEMITFEDFDSYERYLFFEDKLRDYLNNLNDGSIENPEDWAKRNNKEHRTSEANTTGLNIPIIAEEGLNDLYLYSREPDIRFFKKMKHNKKTLKLMRGFKKKFQKEKVRPPEHKLEKLGSGPPTIILDDANSILNFKSCNKIDDKIYQTSDFISEYNDERFERDFELKNLHTNVLNSNTDKKYIPEKDTVHKSSVKKEYGLQRKLRMRHLQMLSIGASIGIGLFLQSGKAISIAGGFGAWLGFFISATLITATLLCFGEIVALLPVNTGVPGILNRFLNPSLSFSVSWVYLISYCISVPSEILASSLLLGYFENTQKFMEDSRGNFAAVLVLFTSFIIFINLLDVRVYAEFEYITSTIKIIIIVGMIIFMIILNAGAVKTSKFSSSYIGFRYWDSSKDIKSEPSITFGAFRPTFDLKDTGFGARNGVKGFGGVILQIIASSTVALYSYIGTEIGYVGAAESSVQLRRSISSVTKRIYIRVILFYLVSIFLIALLLYSGDPRLLRYRDDGHSIDENSVQTQIQTVLNALHLDTCRSISSYKNFDSQTTAMQSPWIIVFSNFGLCKLAKVIDALFVAIGLCAASSQLYVSSRILHSMSIQDKAPKIFSKCNKYGVPYVAVLSCGCFGFLSLLGIHKSSLVSLNRMVQMGTQGAVIMWFFMNVAFLRFFYAVKRRPDLLDRDSKAYPYRSPLQPFTAYYGAASTLCLFLLSGFSNFVSWETKDFIVDYLSLLILFVLYIAYQVIMKPKVFWNIEDIDLDIGRKELDRQIWKENKEYMPNFKEALKKVLSYV